MLIPQVQDSSRRCTVDLFVFGAKYLVDWNASFKFRQKIHANSIQWWTSLLRLALSLEMVWKNNYFIYRALTILQAHQCEVDPSRVPSDLWTTCGFQLSKWINVSLVFSDYSYSLCCFLGQVQKGSISIKCWLRVGSFVILPLNSWPHSTGPPEKRYSRITNKVNMNKQLGLVKSCSFPRLSLTSCIFFVVCIDDWKGLIWRYRKYARLCGALVLGWLQCVGQEQLSCGHSSTSKGTM